jgi:methylenetetrahydrofolate reductase (NADPH)
MEPQPMSTDARRDGRLPTISFEFFPPKSPAAATALWQSVERLAPLGPRFVSVTYGAGGTTRERTMAAILAIRDRARLDVAGHLTCVGASREDVMKVARGYARLGCRRIVALRGDPPAGEGSFAPHPEGFSGSVELVEALAREGGFEIYVGAYPEIHPEAADMAADVEHLKRKIDAGATAAITQFFFEPEMFLRFRDRAAAAGIDAPIIPGILPVDDFDKMARFAARCGTTVPDWMHTAFGNCETEDEHDLLATAIATELADRLIEEGAGHLHVYTLNKPELPMRLCRALGLEAAPIGVAAGCG